MTNNRDQQRKDKSQLIQQKILRAREKASQPVTPVTPTTQNKIVLSDAQQRFWLLNILNPNSKHHNRSFAIKFRGSINKSVLESSIAEVVNRHTILRTVIRTVNNKPVVAVLPPHTVAINEETIFHTDAQLIEDAIRHKLKDFSKSSIDFANGPLLKAALVHTPEYSVLSIVTHHMVFDAWSEEVFKNELLAIYASTNQEKTKATGVLPKVTAQYSDYAKWKETQLSEANCKKLENYWVKQLTNIPVILDLPTDRPRPTQLPYDSDQLYSALPIGLLRDLKKFSQRHQVSLFMTLLTAFYVLLYRYSDQDKFVIGSPISGRTNTAFENTIGYFINTLTLCAELNSTEVFSLLLSKVKHNVLSAFEHQDYPIERIFDSFDFQRSKNRSPLYQVLFNMENIPTTSLELPENTVDNFDLKQSFMPFDLMFDIKECNENIEVKISYQCDLYDGATINRMFGHYCSILQHIIRHEDCPVGRIPLLTVSEYQQQIVTWNQTDVEIDNYRCTHKLFEAQVEKTPDSIALIVANNHYSYQTLNEKANQLAHHLIELGVKPADNVAVCQERSLELIVGMLAILKSGAAILVLEPELPMNRLEFMLQDTGATMLLCNSIQANRFSHLSKPTILDLELIDDTLRYQNRDNPQIAKNMADVMYIIYTSGSTGKSKGVLVEHRNFVVYLTERIKLIDYTETDKVLHTVSFSFDASFSHLFGPICSGACCVLISLSDVKTRVLELIGQYEITYAPFSTAMLNSLPYTYYPKLRTVSIGGEKCSTELARRWGTQYRFFNFYGPTEATIAVTAWEYHPDCTKVTIGKPLANCKIFILDHNLQPVPIGVTGEVYIGGKQLARGYLNQPELTEKSFIANPFGPGRLYKSGDNARYLMDGNIEFIGRTDTQLKIRGYRVEPEEVEAVLQRSTKVSRAVVEYLNDQLVAFCVLNNKQDQDPEQVTDNLKLYLASELPSYMVPVHFIALPSIPLTVNGKINKQELQAILHKHTARNDSSSRQLTITESKIAGIWAKLFNLNNVLPEDDFFELGGHSLMAMQVVHELQKALNTAIPVSYVFQFPTVSELAKNIDNTD